MEKEHGEQVLISIIKMDFLVVFAFRDVLLL